VHQHGALPPSAIAQPNSAPQRVQVLIAPPFAVGKLIGKDSYTNHLTEAPKKIQQGPVIL
jgi:hypothetical protein